MHLVSVAVYDCIFGQNGFLTECAVDVYPEYATLTPSQLALAVKVCQFIVCLAIHTPHLHATSCVGGRTAPGT